MQCDLCLCDKCVIERQLQSEHIDGLREAVKVLATEVVGNALDRAVGKHWDAEIDDAVWDNPIAAAAVREASK